MIKELTMYTIICDNCKKDLYAEADYSGYNEKDYVIDDAMDEGWIEMTDKYYCPDCFTINDNDEIIIKEK